MSTFPIKITFTPAEFAIVQDRLNLGDCIADALLDDEADDGPLFGVSRDEIIDAAICMTGPTVTLSNHTDVAVLMDAIEGSTVPYHVSDALEWGGNPEEQRWARACRRHFRSIERKVEAATGNAVRFPTR